jgi:hypothetical protein
LYTSYLRRYSILYYTTPHLQITRVWELYSLNRSLVSKTGASISWNKRFSENGRARVDYKHCSSLSRDLNPLPPGSSISKDVIDPLQTKHRTQLAKNFQGAVWSPSVGRVTYLPHPPFHREANVVHQPDFCSHRCAPLPPFLSHRLGKKKPPRHSHPFPPRV